MQVTIKALVTPKDVLSCPEVGGGEVGGGGDNSTSSVTTGPQHLQCACRVEAVPMSPPGLMDASEFTNDYGQRRCFLPAVPGGGGPALRGTAEHRLGVGLLCGVLGHLRMESMS